MNIIKEDMQLIIDRLNEEFNQLILQGKVKQAMLLVDGKNHTGYIKRHGECLLCNKIFSRLK